MYKYICLWYAEVECPEKLRRWTQTTHQLRVNEHTDRVYAYLKYVDHVIYILNMFFYV